MQVNQNRFFHTPVLVDAVVHYLITDPDGIYVDGTVGGGGHGEVLLQRLTKKGKLIGIDRDREALSYARDRFAVYGDRTALLQGDLNDVADVLRCHRFDEIDGFFLDLGVSSHQIDSPSRGFSYLADGPLDMRMSESMQLTAKKVINSYPESDLADIFYWYGEERWSRRIARKIVSVREKRSIQSTLELAAVVRSVTPGKFQIKTLARIWQALRFEVNDEINQLREGLLSVYPLLKTGGRMVVISWESLMDRMIKRFFRGETPEFRKSESPDVLPDLSFCVLTRRVVRPDDEEIEINSRARSARLRAAEKREIRMPVI